MLDPEAESGLSLRPRPRLFDGQGLGTPGAFLCADLIPQRLNKLHG
uniref:Uncharacterized protein n=1 Tax=Pseudomonas fluorescens (strain SBW25) TaxID=216595 RepID=A0A0G4E5V1_PSEFS|nr:hypothetical protein PQBR55_0211 [Pseudomonas fluorescens SBW25]